MYGQTHISSITSAPQPPTTHHNHHTRLRQVARTLVNFYCAFSGRHAVAWRTRCGSRQRRLRSWLRHERMTVAMTLAEMTHHTAPRGPTMARVGEGVEHEQHDGLRAQKPPLPGVRPGSLFDPGPQRSDRTVRHSAGDTPLLVVPALHGNDGVDGTTLRFLLEQNLSLKKKQEEREMKEKEAQKVKREEKLLELAARQRAASRELDTLLLVPFVRRSDQEEERVVQLQNLLNRLGRDRTAFLLAPSKRKKKKKKKRRKRTRRACFCFCSS